MAKQSDTFPSIIDIIIENEIKKIKKQLPKNKKFTYDEYGVPMEVIQNIVGCNSLRDLRKYFSKFEKIY